MKVSHPGERPRIVVISGSTRFHREMHAIVERETLAGRIVLVVGNDKRSDDEMGLTEECRQSMLCLHRHKIDLADEMLVVNVGGYVGEATASEIAYAEKLGKPVRYEYEQ